MVTCGKLATHVIFDCASGSPVCREHSKRKYILGRDNLPFEKEKI